MQRGEILRHQPRGTRHDHGATALGQPQNAVGARGRPQQCVLREIAGRLRQALARQVIGRGAENHRRPTQRRRALALGQPAVAAQLHIEGFGAADFFGVDEPQLDLRKALEEARHQRRHQQPTEALVDGHTQQRTLGHRLQRGARSLDFERHTLAVREDGFAGRGEPDAPRGALEQARAQGLFQRRHRAADAHLGNLQFARRGSEAIELNHPGENRHIVRNH